jgi:hypothetical protein
MNGLVVESERSQPLVVSMTVLQSTIATPRASVSESQPASRPEVEHVPSPRLACVKNDEQCFTVEQVAAQLEEPAALTPSPDGRLFFTERQSSVRVLVETRLAQEPALHSDEVRGRISDLSLHPGFLINRFVYVAWVSDVPDRDRELQVVRYREVGNQLGEAATVIASIPLPCSGEPKMGFGPDSKLYIAVPGPDNSSCAGRREPYDGLVLRFNEDGTVPRDNRLGSPIFSAGHPQPTALAWDPSRSQLWISGRSDAASFPSLVVVLAQATARQAAWPLVAYRPSFDDGPGRTGLPAITSFTITPPQADQAGSFVYLTAGYPQAQLLRARVDPARLGRVAAIRAVSLQSVGEPLSAAVGEDGHLYVAVQAAQAVRASRLFPDGKILRLRLLP